MESERAKASEKECMVSTSILNAKSADDRVPADKTSSAPVHVATTTSKKRKLPQNATTSSATTKRQELETDTVSKETEVLVAENDGNEHTKIPIPWTLKQHRQLVEAVYNIGLIESSPLSIQENMSRRMKEDARFQELNLEKIKSKLQKYRKNKLKYKDEFLRIYDGALSNMNISPEGEVNENSAGVLFSSSNESLSSGAVAAYLTYCTMKEMEKNGMSEDADEGIDSADKEVTGATAIDAKNEDILIQSQKAFVIPQRSSMSPVLLTNHNEMDQKNHAAADDGDMLYLPKLTREELMSPIGESFRSLFSLHRSLRSELRAQRAKIQRIKKDNKSEIADDKGNAIDRLVSASVEIASKTIPNNRDTGEYPQSSSIVSMPPLLGQGVSLNQHQDGSAGGVLTGSATSIGLMNHLNQHSLHPYQVGATQTQATNTVKQHQQHQVPLNHHQILQQQWMANPMQLNDKLGLMKKWT